MEARLYDPAIDRGAIEAWCAGWNMPAPPAEWLSDAGYIVPGVCVAWLYLTNSALAFLECTISNPAADATTRGAAIDAMTAAICAHAKRAGYAWVQGQSKNQRLIQRAAALGFDALDGEYTVFVRSLHV